MNIPTAKFNVGQLIYNRLMDYRGVVVDVDPYFQGEEEWRQNAPRGQASHDRPWYHILVDGLMHRTYVAERNLEADDSGDPVDHEDVLFYFEAMGTEGYIPRWREN